jgi:hypothetical protein
MKKILLFYAFLLIFISCNKEKTQDSNSDISPLRTGNTWKYIDSTFNIKSTDTSKVIVGDYENIKGNFGFAIQYFIKNNSIIFLTRSDEQGNHLLVGGYSDKDSLFYTSIEIKRNAKKNETWNYYDIVVDPNTDKFDTLLLKMICLNDDTMILTPKGFYKCKSYSHSPNNGIDVFINYFSEGIGLIKDEQFENGKRINSKILFDYELSK